MKRVILFGGSFDPIHNGHITIAKRALKERHASEIWFIPTRRSPFKEDGTSFDHRYAMIRNAIKPYRKMHVLTIENELPAPSYTIDTVQTLINQNPHIQFEWLIGSDQIERLDEWKDFQTLQEVVQFIVYHRKGYDATHQFPTVSGVHVDVSSSDIRCAQSFAAPKTVLNYMTVHCLYTRTMLKARLSEYRYHHVMSVYNLALEIAKVHHLDLDAVAVAALYHDFCKDDDKAGLSSLMQQAYPEYASKSPQFYHAYAAKDVLTRCFYYHDKSVLRAIVNHVSGSATHPIAMVLYIADKCERNRDWDSEWLIELSKINLREGFNAVKKRQETYLIKQGATL